MVHTSISASQCELLLGEDYVPESTGTSLSVNFASGRHVADESTDTPK